jgi:hypothetical protein
MNTEIIRKSFELLSNTRKLLLQFSVIVILGSVSLIAMDEQQQVEPKLATYLWRHNIDLTDDDTWPNKQIIALDANANPYALRFKCDLSAKKFTLSLEKESFGNALVDLLTGSISDIATLPLEHTFVVDGQPHFIKFSIDSTKITLERISTPLHFYMTVATPIVVQNGIDDQAFGIIESRGGSVFLGVRKDVMTGKSNPGDCRFNPTDPELSVCAFSQFNNVYGGVYVPKGKLLIATHDSISNGHGITTQITTTFVCKSVGVTKEQTHPFYIGGNGSFMRSLSGMMLNSRYISNLYNEIEVYEEDMVFQGPPSSNIRITGNIKTSGNMWIMANQYDVRQERQDVIIHLPYAGSLRGGEISLSHSYPYIKMSGHHHIRCDYVYINHPSGGWQPHIVDVPCGKESSSNYNNNGNMVIRLPAVTRLWNLDNGTHVILE